MRRTTLILLGVLALAAIVGMGLALQGVARESIVMPVLYLVWLGRLIFRSIPDVLWWAWLLLMAFIIAGKSFAGRMRSARVKYRQIPLTEGPVSTWARRIQVSGQGSYFRWRLAHEIAELGLDLLMPYDRSASRRRERDGFVEALTAPPEIKAFFQAGMSAQPWESMYLSAKLKRWLRIGHHPTALDLDPAQAVTFLEENTERTHDA